MGKQIEPGDAVAHAEHAVEVWNSLGEAGRTKLLAHLGYVRNFSLSPTRAKKALLVIRDVAAMTCVAHPLEQVARAYGCDGPCCSESYSLQGVGFLERALDGTHHAAALLKAFLTDPHLAFPPDIPDYAERALAFVEQQMKAVERREAKKAKAAAREAAKIARQLAAAAYKKSYAYRIAQAEKKAAKIREELQDRQRLVEHTERRLAKQLRSVRALVRAAHKKGEKTS